MRSVVASSALMVLICSCADEAPLVLDCEMTRDLADFSDSVGSHHIFRIPLQDFSERAGGCDYVHTVNDEMTITSAVCAERDSRTACRNAFERTIAVNRITGKLTHTEQCRSNEGALSDPFVKQYQCEKAEQKF